MSMETSRDHAASDERKVENRPFSKHLPPPAAARMREMEAYLKGRDLPPMLAYRNLWYPSILAGDDIPRIVIPATSGIPGNLYWQARAMVPAEKRYQSPHAPRGDAIIVVWPSTHSQEEFVLVEGPMDALAAAEWGYTGVALMGGVPEGAIDLISHMFTERPLIAIPDRDDIRLVLRAALSLQSMGHRIRVVDPYPAKDLAALSYAERVEKLGR